MRFFNDVGFAFVVSFMKLQSYSPKLFFIIDSYTEGCDKLVIIICATLGLDNTVAYVILPGRLQVISNAVPALIGRRIEP